MTQGALQALKWGLLGYGGPKALAGLMTNPAAARYLAGGLQGPSRQALGLLSRAPLGAAVPAYLLTAQQ